MALSCSNTPVSEHLSGLHEKQSVPIKLKVSQLNGDILEFDEEALKQALGDVAERRDHFLETGYYEFNDEDKNNTKNLKRYEIGQIKLLLDESSAGREQTRSLAEKLVTWADFFMVTVLLLVVQYINELRGVFRLSLSKATVPDSSTPPVVS